jgi:hypothetical protein
MSLPFLSICPTGMAGTNQDESGPSDESGGLPLSDAAKSAMSAAWGDAQNAIVMAILSNMHAGQADGAQELACTAVLNLMSIFGLTDTIGNEDEVWETLVNNVFPKDTFNKMWSSQLMPGAEPFPTTMKDFFFAMCNRYAEASAVKKIHKKNRRLWSKWDERDGGAFGTGPVSAKARGRSYFYADKMAQLEDGALLIALGKLETWGPPDPPPPRRQWTVYPSPRSPSESDDEDAMGED